MSTMSYHCTSNPMEEHRTETSWSECFQDLASWCHLPQDELTNATNVTNQSEYKDSFDDQSMYYWEANSSSVDLKGEADPLSLQYSTEEANKNSLIPLMSDNQDAKDAAIRYSCNMVLTPGIDQDMGSCQNEMKTINWNDMAPLTTPNYPTPLTIISTKRQNIPPKQEIIAVNKPKPPLKLDINAACTRAPTATSDLTTSIPVNTPEVLNTILEVEDSSFNLFSFIEGYDDQNLMAVDPNAIVSQRPKETLATISQKVIKIDHDYTTETPPTSEPLTLKNVSAFSLGLKALPMIPEEDCDIKPCVKEEPSSPSPSTSTSLGKRVRRTMADEDYIYDEEPSSDNSTDWSPVMRKKAKNSKKKNGEGLRTRTSSFSDSGSVTSGPDKYRELRDRNNEASRRSRMNRKQKEVEMLDRANALQKDNEVLRVKAESLEKRVKTLRRILLQRVQKAALQAR